MNKKKTEVNLPLAPSGAPGAGPGVVVVDASGLTLRTNLTQIARPYRTTRLEFEDLESAVGGGTSVFLRSRNGGIQAVEFTDPEPSRAFAGLVNVGIAAHDPRPDPNGVLSASAPAGVRKALEEEHKRERKEAKARLETALEEAREAFGVEPAVPSPKPDRYKPGPDARLVAVGSGEERREALDDFVRRHAPRVRALCFDLAGGGYVELGHGPEGYYLYGPEAIGRPSTEREVHALLGEASGGRAYYDSLRKEAVPAV